MASNILNPYAEEFYPTPHHHHHHHHPFNIRYTNSPFFSAPNPSINPFLPSNFLYYSPFIHYSANTNTSFPENEPDPSELPQNHDNLPRPPPVPAVTEPNPSVPVLVPAKKVIPTSSLKRREGYWNEKSRFGSYNEKEKGYQIVKKEWRAKHGDRICYTAGSNSKSGSRSRRRKHASQRHTFLPVESDGQITSVMIRNIPNRYNRELLMEFLDNHCMLENEKANKTVVSAFDFLYLPMDFENKANKGYAFVNFTDPRAAWEFHLAVENKNHGWKYFQSSKICEVASARLQGKEALVGHFQSSSFECETDDYLPVCFSPPRDGSMATVKQTIIGKRIG